MPHMVLTIQAVQQAEEDWYSVINLANNFSISILKGSQTNFFYVRWTSVDTCYASIMLFKFSCLLPQSNEKRLRYMKVLLLTTLII